MRAWAILALACASACEPQPPPAPTTASGSFTVVREVGRESDGHSPLGLVTASLPWGGGFVILEPLDGRVRLIPGTPDTVVREIGSRGGGPGEFVQPSIMGIAGGRLSVLEPSASDAWPASVARVTRFGPEGDTLAVLPVRMPVHPVDQAGADSLILSRYPPGPGRGLELTERAYVAHFRNHLHIPDTVPAAEFAILDLEGRIWVGGWGREGERPWKVFGPLGEPLGGVRLPSDLLLHGARGDSIWGVRRGEYDETIFVVARVTLE